MTTFNEIITFCKNNNYEEVNALKDFNVFLVLSTQERENLDKQFTAELKTVRDDPLFYLLDDAETKIVFYRIKKTIEYIENKYCGKV